MREHACRGATSRYDTNEKISRDMISEQTQVPIIDAVSAAIISDFQHISLPLSREIRLLTATK
jgi:hypothetical protein